MGEILNRREQIIANKLPPEIPDVDTLVTKTDYATASKAGVVKIGSNINVSSGKISIPAASDETPGVVKVGENLSVDENGFLNASGGGFTLTKIGELASPVTGASADITCTRPITDFQALLIWNTNNDNQAASTFIPVADFVANGAYRTLVDTSNSGSIANGFINKKADDTTDTIVTIEAKSGMKFKTLVIYGI